ncbi:hypothetical protein GOA97_18965 [Sinorhizobium meliloti]|nr:hypothetical protein [Sinorhizobium meliloti]MDW9656541.1 hypothetical protein [Sinorhizobium meliloti]MDW9916351.1 hypothetical protein [Sinorhizobium meliloti]MDW9939660.1 hypothetical protein [Sinorhizobium meliloti]MDW9945883.1 hypothetical protein [Sinorhizobium meliloti]
MIAPGVIVTYRGQRYHCRAVRLSDDGRKLVARWSSRCADCGSFFSFRYRAHVTRRFAPNRRCWRCAHPGKPVEPPRKRKAKVKAEPPVQKPPPVPKYSGSNVIPFIRQPRSR